MANEFSISFTFSADKRSADNLRQLLDKKMSRSFSSDLKGVAKGPCIGSFLVPLAGVTVSLSELTTPGLYVVENQGLASGADVGDDPSLYYFEWGIREPATGLFYPKDELWVGDAFPGRFSRNLLEEYTNTGTGTSAATNQLHFKAVGAAQIAALYAFEQ